MNLCRYAAVCALLSHGLILWGQSDLASPTDKPAAVTLRRFEVGGQVSDMRAVCGGTGSCVYPSFGLGPGASINLGPHLAIDGAVHVTTGASHEYSGVAGGRGTEFLIGPRFEARAEHFGFFSDVKAGWMHWSHTVSAQLDVPPYAIFGTHNLFVSSLGGGAEYSPGDRIHFRAEVSDLVVRDGPGAWGSHFQGGAGVYADFGKPVQWKPPVYDAKKAHPFFGLLDLVLLTGSVLATTADSITTQRFISRGYREGDPLAAPLVKYGWSGQISAAGIEIGGEVLAMYGLHRIGAHWIERILPASIATAHGVLAYNNTKISLRAHPANSAP